MVEKQYINVKVEQIITLYEHECAKCPWDNMLHYQEVNGYLMVLCWSGTLYKILSRKDYAQWRHMWE